jgi:1,4-dihydroxy-2-naphthoate octaprenyltransferase
MLPVAVIATVVGGAFPWGNRCQLKTFHSIIFFVAVLAIDLGCD